MTEIQRKDRPVSDEDWLAEAKLLRVLGESLARKNAEFVYRLGDWWNSCPDGRAAGEFRNLGLDSLRLRGARMLGMPPSTLQGYAMAAQCPLHDRSVIDPTKAAIIYSRLDSRRGRVKRREAVPRYLELAKTATRRELKRQLDAEFPTQAQRLESGQARLEAEDAQAYERWVKAQREYPGCATNLWTILEGVCGRLLREQDIWDPDPGQVQVIRKQMAEIDDLLDRKSHG